MSLTTKLGGKDQKEVLTGMFANHPQGISARSVGTVWHGITKRK
jgi:hypothetical protein